MLDNNIKISKQIVLSFNREDFTLVTRFYFPNLSSNYYSLLIVSYFKHVPLIDICRKKKIKNCLEQENYISLGSISLAVLLSIEAFFWFPEIWCLYTIWFIIIIVAVGWYKLIEKVLIPDFISISQTYCLILSLLR